jgi:hypothetical protein
MVQVEVCLVCSFFRFSEDAVYVTLWTTILPYFLNFINQRQYNAHWLDSPVTEQSKGSEFLRAAV